MNPNDLVYFAATGPGCLAVIESNINFCTHQGHFFSPRQLKSWTEMGSRNMVDTQNTPANLQRNERKRIKDLRRPSSQPGLMVWQDLKTFGWLFFLTGFV